MIERGSGHFVLNDFDTALATVSYDPASRQVSVAPHEEGHFLLTAVDRCLEAVVPATATVLISDVHQILLSVVDKVRETIAKILMLLLLFKVL